MNTISDSNVSAIANANSQKSNPNIKKYIGCKIIAAEPMDYEAWARSQNKWHENQETMGEGYKVTYPDNYVSWSPKKVFEEAYREISMQEMGIIHNEYIP